MPVTPAPVCVVLHCPDFPSGQQHELRIDRDGPGPVCATHKERIDAGESWLWVPWHRLKGVGSEMSEGCILMGEELAGYGLVVDAEVHLGTSLIFSPVLAEGRETITLAIEGRLFGVNQLVSLELVLEPEALAPLREALRFLRP